MAVANRKRRIREYLETHHVTAITGDVWTAMLRDLAPISENYLRHVLAKTGLPFEQPYAGVRQHGFDELERSLEEIGAVYADAMARGDRDLARYCRRQVITAKDHGRLAARNPHTRPDVRTEKEEMVEWMLVWLGDPAVFPAWVRTRRQVIAARSTPP